MEGGEREEEVTITNQDTLNLILRQQREIHTVYGGENDVHVDGVQGEEVEEEGVDMVQGEDGEEDGVDEVQGEDGEVDGMQCEDGEDSVDGVQIEDGEEDWGEVEGDDVDGCETGDVEADGGEDVDGDSEEDGKNGEVGVVAGDVEDDGERGEEAEPERAVEEGEVANWFRDLFPDIDFPREEGREEGFRDVVEGGERRGKRRSQLQIRIL